MLLPLLASSVLFMDHPDYSWIHRAVVDRVPAIRHCYERARRREPEVQGRWVVRFTIDLDHQLRDVRLTHQAFRDPEMEACVIEAVQSVHIDGYRMWSPVVVSFPLRFRHAEDGSAEAEQSATEDREHAEDAVDAKHRDGSLSERARGSGAGVDARSAGGRRHVVRALGGTSDTWARGHGGT